MTIHTDTFPAVCSVAAANPSYGLIRRIEEGKPRVYLTQSLYVLAVGFDPLVTPAFLMPSSLYTKMKEDAVKINIIANEDFKHLLERLEPTQRIVI